MNRLVLSLAVAVALAAGCGGASPTSPSAPGASSTVPASSSVAPASADTGSSSGPVGSTVEACDLLTEEDIKEITGLTIAEASSETTMGIFANGCEWSLEGEAASSATAITLGVLVPGGRGMWERSFKPFGEEMGMEDLEGVGDEAQLGDIDDVIAVQGDTLVSIQFLGTFGLPDDLSVDLTKRVLENLSAG